MRSCPACRRWFRNKQAIRQHLRWCRAYQARKIGMKLVRCFQCKQVSEIGVHDTFRCRFCGSGAYYEY